MKNINILIIEDQLIIYLHLIKVLNSIGLKKIFVARNAEKAIEIAKSRKINLLLSDIKIQGEKTGIDAVSVIQTIYNVPVIFITAFYDNEILKKISNIDIIGYLLKPYRVDELEVLIKLAIEKYNLNSNDNNIVYKNYIYCFKENKLFYNDIEVDLTKKEKVLVHLLFTNINKIITYDTLENIIWQNNYVLENTRRNLIYRFKKKNPDLNILIEKNVGISLSI